MRYKIYLPMIVFILVVSSAFLVSAQDERTFDITKSVETTGPISVNQNALSKFSTQTLNQIKVNFITNPTNSNLYIDNINYGIAPKSVYLDPEAHEVRVSKSGFFTADFNIFLKSGYIY